MDPLNYHADCLKSVISRIQGALPALISGANFAHLKAHLKKRYVHMFCRRTPGPFPNPSIFYVLKALETAITVKMVFGRFVGVPRATRPQAHTLCVDDIVMHSPSKIELSS